MANEIAMFSSLAFQKGGSSDVFDHPGEVRATMTGTKPLRTRQTIGTSEEALQLGEVSPAGALIRIYNHGPTNFVSIKQGTAGAGTGTSIKILAGEFGIFRFNDAVTAPFAQANVAPVDIEFLLLPA